MNPAFSVSHIKRLAPIFNVVSKQVRKVMAADIEDANREETDVLDYMSRMALELVSQGGFGHSFGALTGEPNVLSSTLKSFSCAIYLLFGRKILRKASTDLPARSFSCFVPCFLFWRERSRIRCFVGRENYCPYPLYTRS